MQNMKALIEEHANQAMAHNPIFTLSSSGEMKAQQIRYYLSNLKMLVDMSRPNLLKASHLAKERGLDSLSAFLQEKADEEEGHGEWAREDMDNLSRRGATVQTDPTASTAIQNLLEYHQEIIEKDPYLYVSYIFLVEYFTVLVGPSLIQNLNEKCGIPPDCMTIVGNHVELDKDHVAEGLKFLTSDVPAEYEKPFINVMDKAMDLYNAFGREVSNA